MPSLDQIALTVRGCNEIWILDHSTTTKEAAGHTGGKHGKGGDLIYRWGNPAAYGRGTMRDQQLIQQHDAEWIPAAPPEQGTSPFSTTAMTAAGRASRKSSRRWTPTAAIPSPTARPTVRKARLAL